MEGHLDRASELAEKAAERVGIHGWPVVGAHCWKVRAEIAMRRGQLDDARNLLEEAINRFEPTSVAHLQTRLSRIYLQLGRLDNAWDAAEAAVQSAVRPADRYDGHGELAYIAKSQGRLAEAEDHLAKCLPDGEVDRYRRAHVYNLQGELLREKGDLDGAETAYRRSLAIWEAIGVLNRGLYSTINLGIVLIMRQDHPGAVAIFDEVRTQAEALVLPNVVAIADIALLGPTAAMGRWDDFDSHLEAWNTSICRDSLYDTDLALMLGVAGDFASRAQKMIRARAVYAQAAAQWQQLGIADKAKEYSKLASA
ncbi:MAG: tetratricopeptide repeat protein [Polyangiaceae bacterium]